MTIEFIILGVLGVAIHYLKEWVWANKAGKQYDFKKAFPMASLSLITTVTLVYLRKDIEDLYVITKFSAVALGYFGNSIFFSFVDTKKPKNVPGIKEDEEIIS